MQEKLEFVEGKVDWKGRQALKNKHGGLWTSLLILGMYPIWMLENINYIQKLKLLN
jgi:peptide/histidine transporter 3/4